MKAGTCLDGGMFAGRETHSYFSPASLLQHARLPRRQPPTGPETWNPLPCPEAPVTHDDLFFFKVLLSGTCHRKPQN